MTRNQYRALRAQVAGWSLMVIANLMTDSWWMRVLFIVMGTLNFYVAYKLERDL